MNATDATAWHSLTAEEVVQRLKSSVTAGLDAVEAASREAQYGLNLLPTARKRGPLMRFLMQFKNVLVYVLIAAGFIKLMMGLWLDASIILGVVVINGLLGFIQEGRAEKSLEFDPQHAFGGGEDLAQRANRHDPGRDSSCRAISCPSSPATRSRPTSG